MDNIDVPKFCKLDNEKVIFNEEGELLYFVPENYFVDVKQHPIAERYGQYVSLAGIFDWALVDTKGKIGDIKPFMFPSIMLCKPSFIEKVKGYVINDTPVRDYRIFHFMKGDEVISDINTPNIIDNVETLFGMMIVSANKMPNTIPYKEIYKYFPKSMEVNGDSYGVNMQFFGMITAELYADPKDPTRPYRLTDMKNPTGYKRLSIKQKPNYVSPFVAITNENIDESIMSAVLLDNPDEYKESPLEKIMTM